MHFKFRMPITSIILIALSILMLWISMEVFDALRYMQCTKWTSLWPSPGWIIRLSSVGLDRVYAQTLDGTTYCYKDQWTTACTMSPYASTSANARDWVSSQVLDGKPIQLIRGGSLTKVTYYALMENGTVLSCSTDMKAELDGILNSWAIIWLLIPVGIGIWSAAIFMKMFIENGQPTLWDWSGRGTRIK